MTHEIVAPRIRPTTEEMVTRAEKLYDCLPCLSLDLPRKLGISRTEIMSLLHFIRSKPVDKDGVLMVPFTVPHGKRGPGGSWYIPVLINKDRSYYVDRHNLDHIEDGAIGTLKEMISKSANESHAIACFAAGIRPGAIKWYMEDIARNTMRQAEDIKHFLKRVEQTREEREVA